MGHPFRYTLALIPALALCGTVAETTGCAATGAASCKTSLFISPTSVTLDHTLTGAGNAQTFSTGTSYSTGCAVPQVLINYTWNVSDTIDAKVTVDNGVSTVSCVNATAAPITVYSSIITYSGNPPVATNTPTNLPTATLTCK